MACQRADREERLVNQLGRGGSRPNRLIVVSTQVIEQSLDIDLDVLVTDLGPVDSVLQRIGRLHRHQTSVRPERLSNPVVFIDHVPMNRAVEPFLERGAHAVYGAKNLLSSAFVLRGHLAGQPLTLDDDIPGLVAAAYGDLALPQPWAAVVDAETKSTDTTARVTVRDAYVLRPTMTRMTGMLHCHADDSVSSTMVRDGELGVEVILVRKTGDRTVTGMPGTALNGRELSLDVTPSRADAAQLAGCVVRLPLRVSRRLLGRADIREPAGLTFPAWRRSALLADALVLPVADDGAVLAGLTVSYDQAIGLTVS